jgi:hypothetical protein
VVILSVSIEFTLNLVAKYINISSLLTASVINVSGRKDESSLFKNTLLVLLLYCRRPRCGLCEAHVLVWVLLCEAQYRWVCKFSHMQSSCAAVCVFVMVVIKIYIVLYIMYVYIHTYTVELGYNVVKWVFCVVGNECFSN